MDSLVRGITTTFDTLEARWEQPRTRQVMAALLIVSFFTALIAIEANRQGWIPGSLGLALPTNHFYAIDVAFSLFLVFEVISLVFGLATSVAEAAGKQFEIFSLIMLRQSFKELVKFQEEPISWSLSEPESVEAVQLVLSDATSALLIFVIIGFFYKLQRHQSITKSDRALERFIAAKKGLALILLMIFAGMGGYAVYTLITPRDVFRFFDAFYTVLIFSDVLVVFIALRYSSTFYVVFRNSGFAAATVMIRLALAGPRYLDGAIGVGAALYAVGLTAAYNYVAPVLSEEEPTEAPPGAPEEEDRDEDAPDEEPRRPASPAV
jgi:hypothetical protein